MYVVTFKYLSLMLISTESQNETMNVWLFRSLICWYYSVIKLSSRLHMKYTSTCVLFLLMSMCFLYTVSSPISPLDSSGLLSPALSDDTDDDNAEKETFEVIMNKGVTGLGFLIEGGKASAKGDQPLIIKRIFKGKEQGHVVILVIWSWEKNSK